MNSVNIMGRIVRDPIVRYGAETQKAVATFTLAVQDRFSNERADFISCKAFGKTGEIVEKYLHKGEFVGVTGRIQTGSYEKDGKKVYTTDVIVDELSFTPKISKEEVKEDVEAPTGFSKLDDSDIPF